MSKEKFINDYGRVCFKGVTKDTDFLKNDFYRVEFNYCDDICFALHTNLGSLTVVDRMTGFGWRDIESGYRDEDGNFWLASGMYDVRDCGEKTIGDAIKWIKKHANTCLGGKNK